MNKDILVSNKYNQNHKYNNKTAYLYKLFDNDER